MSGTPVEIHWFPRNSNRFLTWGSEINLYEVKNSDEIDHRVSTSMKSICALEKHQEKYIFNVRFVFFIYFDEDINLDISTATTATLLASETRYQYIRCVAPSYRSSGDLLLAVGLANGKVGLCNFVPSNENNIEFSKSNIVSFVNLLIRKIAFSRF